METEGQLSIEVHFREDDALATMPLEVRAGLGMRAKQLPSKYFYDRVGSHLFEKITELPEYYPTRAELSLLDEVAPEVARIAAPRELLELGSGSARKTHRLIDAMSGRGSLGRYLPFDVSQSAVKLSMRRLAESYPDLKIHGIVGDYERHLGRVPTGHDRLVAFLGGTIGNFPFDRGVGFLQQVYGVCGDGGWLLLGTDLVKDRSVLEAAHNDSAGVTAEFNLNILAVLNRRLDADFDLERFEHVAIYDPSMAWIEMQLRSKREQTVRIGALDETFRFAQDEIMRTEISRKFTRTTVERLLNSAGFSLERWFTDEDERFALSLARHA